MWGGLYWRRGTVAGAWTAMIVGSGLSIVFWFVQTFWYSSKGGFALNEWVVRHYGQRPHEQLGAIVIGGAALIAAAAVGALLVYVILRDRKAGHRPGGSTLLGIGVSGALLAAGIVALAAPGALSPLLNHWPTPLTVEAYLHGSDRWTRFPFNGQYLSITSMMCAGISYVTVSLLTCRAPFNMDRMLHRGVYAVLTPDAPQALPTALPVRARFKVSKIIGIDEFYNAKDKALHYFTFYWGLWPNIAAVVIVGWNLFHRWPDGWWWAWHAINGLYITLVLGVITTVWFTIGTTVDLVKLFKVLPTLAVDDNDDGRVIGHHNANEPAADATKDQEEPEPVGTR